MLSRKLTQFFLTTEAKPLDQEDKIMNSELKNFYQELKLSPEIERELTPDEEFKLVKIFIANLNFEKKDEFSKALKGLCKDLFYDNKILFNATFYHNITKQLIAMDLFTPETVNAFYGLLEQTYQRFVDIHGSDFFLKGYRPSQYQYEKLSAVLSNFLTYARQSNIVLTQKEFITLCRSPELFALAAYSMQMIRLTRILLYDPEFKKSDEKVSELKRLDKIAKNNLSILAFPNLDIQSIYRSQLSFIARNGLHSLPVSLLGARDAFKDIYFWKDIIDTSKRLTEMNKDQAGRDLYDETINNFILAEEQLTKFWEYKHHSTPGMDDLSNTVTQVIKDATGKEIKSIGDLISDYSFFKPVVIPRNNFFAETSTSEIKNADDAAKFLNEVSGYGSFATKLISPILQSLNIKNKHTSIFMGEFVDGFHLLKELEDKWPEDEKIRYISVIIPTRLNDQKQPEHASLVMIDRESKTIECIDPKGSKQSEVAKYFVEQAKHYSSQMTEELKGADVKAMSELSAMLRNEKYTVITPPASAQIQQVDNLYCVTHCILNAIGIILNKENPEFDEIDGLTAMRLRSLMIDVNSGRGISERGTEYVLSFANALKLADLQNQKDEAKELEEKALSKQKSKEEGKESDYKPKI